MENPDSLRSRSRRSLGWRWRSVTVGWNKIADVVTGRIKQDPASVQERYLAALYLAAVAWMGVATVLGYWTTKLVARLL